MRGWICDVIGYPMPPGLVPKQEVTVTHASIDMMVGVRDSAGAEHELFHWQIGVDHELLIGGEYFHEGHPRAQREIQRWLADFKRHPIMPGDTYREQARDLLQDMLRRNEL